MKRTQTKTLFGSDEIAAFCTQMAFFLKGGMPLYEGAYMLYSEMEDGKTKAILKILDEQLKANESFYQALNQTHAFPVYMVQMVHLGEKTGKLQEVLEFLAHYYERDCKMKEGVKGVVSYPFLLFTMMAVILIVLVSKILPMFEDVFYELSEDASKATTSMFHFSITLGRTTAVVVAVLFVLLILLWFANRTKKGHQLLEDLCAAIPITKKLYRQMSIGKILAALNVCVSSGMDAEEALCLTSCIVSGNKVQQKIKACQTQVKAGMSLEEALKSEGLLSQMQYRMLSVGIKTGVSDTVLEQLSEQQDDAITTRLQGISVWVETILMLLLSIIVGMILLSVMLPLISVISSIG